MHTCMPSSCSTPPHCAHEPGSDRARDTLPLFSLSVSLSVTYHPSLEASASESRSAPGARAQAGNYALGAGGGKMEDITVLVARVLPPRNLPAHL
jgi:hypothetical protein